MNKNKSIILIGGLLLVGTTLYLLNSKSASFDGKKPSKYKSRGKIRKEMGDQFIAWVKSLF